MSPCSIGVHPLLCWYALVVFIDICCYVLMMFVDPHCCGQLVLVKALCCALLVLIKVLCYTLLVLISVHWHFLVFYWCSFALLGALLMLVDTPWYFNGVYQYSLLWSIGVCQELTHWHFRYVLFVHPCSLLKFVVYRCSLAHWNSSLCFVDVHWCSLLKFVGVHQHINAPHYVLLVFINVLCWSLLVLVDTSPQVAIWPYCLFMFLVVFVGFLDWYFLPCIFFVDASWKLKASSFIAHWRFFLFCILFLSNVNFLTFLIFVVLKCVFSRFLVFLIFN